MMERKRIHWPIWVLILDLVGSALVGLGIYAQIASGPLLFSEFIDLRALAVPIIIVGALLVAPLVFMTISQLRSSP